MALALGKSLEEVMHLSAVELDVWRLWHEQNGFPDDRVVWATAIGAAYAGGAWGGKAKPHDLIPQFQRAGTVARETSAADISGVKAWFDGMG